MPNTEKTSSETQIESGQSQIISGSDSSHESKQKTFHKKWLLVIVGALAVLFIIGGVLGYLFINSAMMPNLVGLTPVDAQKSIQDISDKWTINFVDEEGRSVIIEELDYVVGFYYDTYEVKSTEPRAGSKLYKSDAFQMITITIGMTEEAREAQILSDEEQAQKKKVKREALIQTTKEDIIGNGWSQVDINDEGYVVDIKIYSNHMIQGITFEGEIITEKEAVHKRQEIWAEGLAYDFGSAVILTLYNSDGSIYDTASVSEKVHYPESLFKD